MELSIAPGGNALLTFADRAEKPVLSLNVRPDGNSALALHGPGKGGGIDLTIDEGKAKAVVNGHDLTSR